MKLLITLLGLTLFLGYAPLAFARDTERAVRVLRSKGTAYFDDEKLGKHVALTRGMYLPLGGTIVTEEDGSAFVRMRDGSLLNLGKSTRLKLSGYEFQPKKKRRASFKLFVGRIWARISEFVGSENEYVIETQNAVSGVRGTEFIAAYDENGESSVMVVRGSVEMRDLDGSLSQLHGQTRLI